MANSIAPMNTSSETSFASPSIINIASLLPATIISNSLVASSLFLGFIIYSPFLYPILTAATGPPKGIQDIVSAADEAIKAKASVGISVSTESTVGII